MGEFTNFWKEQITQSGAKIDFWIPVVGAILLTVIFEYLAGYIFPSFVVLLGAFGLIRTGLNWEVINAPKGKDYLIVGSLIFTLLIIYFGMIGFVFTRISIFKLLVVALIADIMAYFISWVEFKGYIINKQIGSIISILSGIVIFLTVNFLIGGKTAGFVLGGIAALGALVPGPIPLTVISVLGINYIVDWLATKIDSLLFYFI